MKKIISLIINRDANSRTLAHELYHACILDYIYTVSATENGGLLTQAYGNIANGTDGGAFVEFVSLEEKHGSEIIPKYTEFQVTPNDGEAFAFCSFWFKNKGNNTNIFQLAATKKHKDNSFGTARHSENMLFITTIRGTSSQNNDTVVHEIGHQFGVVNTHVDKTSRIQNIENTDICVMSYSTNDKENITRFDIDCLDDIRKAIEKR